MVKCFYEMKVNERPIKFAKTYDHRRITKSTKTNKMKTPKESHNTLKLKRKGNTSNPIEKYYTCLSFFHH